MLPKNCLGIVSVISDFRKILTPDRDTLFLQVAPGADRIKAEDLRDLTQADITLPVGIQRCLPPMPFFGKHDLRLLLGSFHYNKSIAAFRPASIFSSVGKDKSPRHLVSLARSRVVTWWQRATESRSTPPSPAGIGIEVGPLNSWRGEVETGTMMTERHPGTELKPSWDIIMAGLFPF